MFQTWSLKSNHSCMLMTVQWQMLWASIGVQCVKKAEIDTAVKGRKYVPGPP